MDLASDINIENAAPLVVGKPPAKKHKKHHKPHEDCQNCGAKLTGDYCHACGQHGHIHRSVFHVVEEVIHGITHFDSRTWRSLPMLAFRPGTLTRNYVMGQRTRYVPPFAMFLFSIFTMFLVFAFSGGPNLVTTEAAVKSERVQAARERLTDLESDLKDVRTEITDAQQQLTALRATVQLDRGEIGAATGELAGARARAASVLRSLDTAKADLAVELAKPADTAPSSESKTAPRVKASLSFDTEDDRRQALAEISAEKDRATKEGNIVEANALAAAEKLAASAPQSPSPANKTLEVDSSEGIGKMLTDSMRDGTFILTPWPEINAKIKKKTANPELFIYKLQNTAYKFSFLLVPLSLPFIWLMLFWKKNVTLYDHAVFSLYSLSFVSFLFMMISLGAHWFSLGLAFGVAAVIMPVHIFFQFKGAYQLKWFSAFWRTSLFCSLFAWVIMTTFFILIITLGVTG